MLALCARYQFAPVGLALNSQCCNPGRQRFLHAGKPVHDLRCEIIDFVFDLSAVRGMRNVLNRTARVWDSRKLGFYADRHDERIVIASNAKTG